MTLVGKYELFRAEVRSDECLKFSTILRISLSSGTCDLYEMIEGVSVDHIEGDIPTSWYIQPFQGCVQLSALRPRH